MIRHHVFSRFQRFWHWAQTALVLILIVTGFEIHGTFTLFGFQRATVIHNTAAISFVVLVLFAIFWYITTGEWKSYLPTGNRVSETVRYYAQGIFNNEPHPFKETELSRKNPLQQLTYLILKILVIPVQITTGLLYMYYSSWPEWGLVLGLNWVAGLHTLASFAIVTFLIVHVYATTMGHKPLTHMKAMITGYEEIPAEADVPVNVKNNAIPHSGD